MSIQPYNNTTPPPGWYPDPEDGSNLRWFNGTDWTHQYQAPAQQLAPPPAARRFTIHYGFALVALISLLATLVPGIFWFLVAGNAASDPNSSGAAGISIGMAVLWMLWGGMWTLIWTAFAIQHTLRGRRR